MIRAALLFMALCASNVNACESTAGAQLVSQQADAPKGAIRLGDIAVSQPFAVYIEICETRDVIALSVDAIMPAHQHAMNYKPTVTTLGSGDFEVQGLVFHMPGLWEIQVALTQKNGRRRYTHRVHVP